MNSCNARKTTSICIQSPDVVSEHSISVVRSMPCIRRGNKAKKY